MDFVCQNNLSLHIVSSLVLISAVLLQPNNHARFDLTYTVTTQIEPIIQYFSFVYYTMSTIIEEAYKSLIDNIGE